MGKGKGTWKKKQKEEVKVIEDIESIIVKYGAMKNKFNPYDDFKEQVDPSI